MKKLTLLLALLAVGTVSAFPPTPTDQPEGFVPLFNGKDLKGWIVYNGEDEDWIVQDGLLVTPGKQNKNGCWLMTEKEYGNFQLLVEYRIEERANSGVALRAPLKGDPAFEGMEIQILDDNSYPNSGPTRNTAAVYDVVGPDKNVAKAPGEWNTLLITCSGSKMVVRVNGTRVINTDLNDFKDRADRHPGILRQKGRIGLQSHTGRAEFRKVLIKQL